MQHADSITSVSLRISVHYTRASANSVDEDLVLPDGITLTPGRPEIGDMLSATIGCASALKNTTTEGVHGVVVGSCGPEELMANIRRVEHAIGSKVRAAVGGVELVEEYVSSASSRGIVAPILIGLSFTFIEPLLGDHVGPRQTPQTHTASHIMFLSSISCVDRIYLSSSLFSYIPVVDDCNSPFPSLLYWTNSSYLIYKSDDERMGRHHLILSINPCACRTCNYLDTVYTLTTNSKSSSFRLFLETEKPFALHVPVPVPYDRRSVAEYVSHRPPKYIGGGVEDLLFFMALWVTIGR